VLDARRLALSLLAQLRCFLCKAFFKGGSLCETAALGMRCSIHSRIGGSATDVLSTDDCHETGR